MRAATQQPASRQFERLRFPDALEWISQDRLDEFENS